MNKIVSVFCFTQRYKVAENASGHAVTARPLCPVTLYEKPIYHFYDTVSIFRITKTILVPPIKCRGSNGN